MSNWQCGPSGCTNINQMPLGGRNAGGSSGPTFIAWLQGSGSDSCSGGGGSCGYGSTGPLPIAGLQTYPGPTPFGCCLDGATLITMADYSLKMASEIAVGDELLGITDAGCPRMQTVTRLMSGVKPRIRLSVEGTKDLICTETHPFAIRSGGWVLAGDLKVGDFLIDQSGEPVEILSMEPVEPAPVFIWTCEPDHTFFANGILNHNEIKQAIPDFGYPDWV
jgi:hypothetical protein